MPSPARVVELLCEQCDEPLTYFAALPRSDGTTFYAHSCVNEHLELLRSTFPRIERGVA